ncbi:helix-turn-helix domain-containing protein [Halorhabdus sp. CBA1104]|uniref:helix-turn-helix domain-containing protein n=1 Tax=unclassified Halorhabdus TaxID=2621901 RepID=UPI0012B1B5F4|nr:MULTISPECIES: helix-turn-helix domain-containing protein [unclassified Halorhabdus]QGN06891.1 helix-turn-helix domain-containing protein [Halorhabdus sp. CBA1104]
MSQGERAQLAERIAGEIACSERSGETIRKWRTDFEVSQTELADRLDVSPSVVSDYESGRRDNPGIAVVRRTVEALLDIDEGRGGRHIRQHARVISAGYDRDSVLDLREFSAAVPIERYFDAIDATQLAAGTQETVVGQTVIDSIAAIRRLSSEEFYRLYGQSSNRVLVFTNVSRGESPLVAMRVVNPTPNAVVLHGIENADVWEHAADLARVDGFALATTTTELSAVLDAGDEQF